MRRDNGWLGSWWRIGRWRMRGERGNEEERDFTHRLVTTGQLVTIEFLAESNFCVTTPLSFV